MIRTEDETKAMAEQYGRKPLLSSFIRVDDLADVVYVAGAAVAGEVFRRLAEPTPAGEWWRTESVDSVIVVRSMRDSA